MTTPVGPSRVPTAWQVAKPVPVEWMRQLREIPTELSHGWVNQFLYMGNLFNRIRGLDGDVVECGLGEGNTFAMLAYLIGSERRGKRPRTLWGFDSFEGWPEPDPSDASPRNPKKGEWEVSEEMVLRRLEESGLSREFPNLDLRIRKGFVGETLPRFPRDRRIALLHLDLDLYPGYRDALEYLFPLVVKGGLVLLDEYQEYHPELPDYVDMRGRLLEKWPGCSRAVDEYFANRPEKSQYYGPTNKYYIVKETD